MEQEIARTVFIDADGSRITAPYIVRTVNVPTELRIPLYAAGAPRSQAELSEYGVTVRQLTQEEAEAEDYAAIYASRPQLSEAVRAYIALFDGTGVEPTADSATIQASGMDQAKMGAILAAMHDVELNYAAAGMPGLSAYYDLAKLIQYLPEE